MECVVKTPLDLSYKAASASFEREDGNLFLCLVFDNQGESGGILSPESAGSYGKESMRLRAVLGKKAKIRGHEKPVNERKNPFLSNRESIFLAHAAGFFQ